MTPTTNPGTILLVGDALENLRLLSQMLAEYGYAVRAAKSGHEALESADAHPPDLILLDVKLPDISGYDVCARIHSHEKTSSVPIIFISGLNETSDKVRGFAVGGIDFITKPYVPDEVLARVRTHIDLSRMRAELEAQKVELQVKNSELRTEIDERIRNANGLSRAITELEHSRLAALNLLEDLKIEIDLRIQNEKILSESEERFRLIFNSSMDAILLTSPTGEIFSANAAACAIFQRTESEICAEGRYGIVDKTDPRLGPALEERTRTGKFIGELLMLRRDGTAFPTEISTSLFKDKNGSDRTTMIIRDITERKRAEDQMRTLSRTVEQSPASIVVTNKDGGIEYVNPKFTALTGYTLDEARGKNPRILKSGEKAPDEYARLWKTILTGKEWRGEFHNRKKNGTLYWESASISPVLDETGRITHFVAVKEDITERKRAEDALRESEERYRMLIRNQGEGISLCDLNDQFVFANPAAEALFQVPPGTLRGRNWHEFIVPEHRAIMHTEHENNRLSDKLTYELDVTTDKGERRSLLITRMKQADKHGMYSGTFSVFRDITERKMMEEKLRESEEYYRTLVETTPDATAIIDVKGNISFASSKVYAVFAISPNHKMVGQAFLELVHQDDHHSFATRFSEIFSQSSEPMIREYRLLKADKTMFWGEVSTSAVVNGRGSVTGVLMLCRDITEKKKVALELVQSQKMESVGRLAGGIAHDFNNVLGIILAYTSMLEKSSMPSDKCAERLQGIDNAVQRGAGLVRQILAFARKTDILSEPMNIVDLARELLSMLRQTFPKTITFTENIAPNIPYIMADRTQIHQALLNLCVNARDAMPHGGSITITIDTQTQAQVREHYAAVDNDAFVRVTVTDTGEGMTEATRLKIFEPFFTTKEEGKGTGLGLSVVFGVVRGHHGFIDVQSAVGEGTTFHLYLPALVHEQHECAAPRQSNTPAPHGSETILLVEDEEYLLEMALTILESHGYRVFVARDGVAAVEMYRQHRNEIGLVFSDMGLPGMAGADAYRQLKEIDSTVKVVFASGYINPDVQSELFKDGAKGFIQKPYTSNDVLYTLRAVLDGK
jgi:PAS domain S-box-containing protein